MKSMIMAFTAIFAFSQAMPVYSQETLHEQQDLERKSKINDAKINNGLSLLMLGTGAFASALSSFGPARLATLLKGNVIEALPLNTPFPDRIRLSATLVVMFLSATTMIPIGTSELVRGVAGKIEEANLPEKTLSPEEIKSLEEKGFIFTHVPSADPIEAVSLSEAKN